MAIPPFHVLDTKIGDRVLNKSAIESLLEGTETSLFSTPPAIGDVTPAAGNFTDLVAEDSLEVGTGTRTAAAVAGAATLNKPAGKITSEALTTAAGASYTLTLTDSEIAAADIVMASVCYGDADAGTPVVTMVTPDDGSCVIIVQNMHASAALNGTIVISFVVIKQ